MNCFTHCHFRMSVYSASCIRENLHYNGVEKKIVFKDANGLSSKVMAVFIDIYYL